MGAVRGAVDSPYTLALDDRLRYESTIHRASVHRAGSFDATLATPATVVNDVLTGRPLALMLAGVATPSAASLPIPLAPLFGERLPALNA